MIRALSGIIVLLLLAPLSSCNKSINFIDPAWKSTAGTQVLRLRWVKKLQAPLPNFLIPEMGEEHDRFNPIETASAGFDTDKRRVFVGASMGGLYCLDVRSGETVWRFDLDDPVGSVPIYDPERKLVFFGADNGRFYAVHARSGRLVWSIDTQAEIRRRPILHNDTLYFVNADSTVFAVDPKQGEVVWQYKRPPVEGFSSAGHAGLVLAGEKLITGFSDGYMVALDSVVGSEIWQHDMASEVTRISAEGVVKLTDADATPVVVGEVLVAASVDGGLHGVDVNTGNVRWTEPLITGVTGLAESNGLVYAARSGYGITAVEPQSGKALWSRKFLAGALLDPVVYGDILLISDSEFGLYVFSTLDEGTLLQRIDQNEGFLARPSMYGGYLMVIGNSGTLYAMSIL